jgi:hypothetical protein
MFECASRVDAGTLEAEGESQGYKKKWWVVGRGERERQPTGGKCQVLCDVSSMVQISQANGLGSLSSVVVVAVVGNAGLCRLLGWAGHRANGDISSAGLGLAAP